MSSVLYHRRHLRRSRFASYGATFTSSTLDQKYGIFGASLAKTFHRHTISSLGFEHTSVDGVEASAQQTSFSRRKPTTAVRPYRRWFFLLATEGGLTRKPIGSN